MGEAVLKDVAAKRGIDIYVDSAGTAGYHVGDLPDERTTSTCRKFKVPISHRARRVTKNDFTMFTHILAADHSNLEYLKRMIPNDSIAIVDLWGSSLDGKAIADPYYDGIEEFETCFKHTTALSHAFLDKVAGSASL
jgi:low molecular weight phosphotyrosine protein phosphatase